MGSDSAGPSLISILSDKEPGSCGYCKGNNGFERHGLWAHELTVEDYQDLVDRGWRRCGKYCYKAIMDKSCCPLYTIRCAAEDFSLSKSQKRILKKMNRFLATGDKGSAKGTLKDTNNLAEYAGMDLDKFQNDHDRTAIVKGMIPVSSPANDSVRKASNVGVNSSLGSHQTVNSTTKKIQPKDFSDNPSLKAKHKRIKRRFEKLKSMGLSEEDIAKKMVEKKRYPVKKTLEDFIDYHPENSAHRLEVRVVRSSPQSDEFVRTYQDGFNLYKIYQVTIHRDQPSRVTDGSYHRFLIRSPLEAEGQYGSYHQQYWLDGVLIAVGVIDILPQCVSSVYFFYNPEYAFLSLGTYGALREIYFTRSLAKIISGLKYYYMGFYIQSCPKMRYKAAFKPSFLLCPEAYTWHPIELAVRKLVVKKYSRLNDDPTALADHGDFNPANVKIAFRDHVIEVGKLTKVWTKMRRDFEEFCQLVGPNCARRMIVLLE